MAKQPETKVTFKVFNKEFNEGIQEMSKESTRLRKEFKLQSEQMKDTADETEKFEAKLSYLGKQQDIVKRKIVSTDKQLEKAKQIFGENSNEANILSNKLLDLRISEQKLENSINQAKSELSNQSQELQEAGTKVDKFRQKIEQLSDSANNAGDSLSTGLSLPLAGVAAIGGKSAIDLDGAIRLMNGSLGAAGEEADQLEDDLRTLWEDGFGENPEQVARAMMYVKQNIQGINSGKELQKATKNMLLLADATESDMSEATRGVNQLMHNFALTADEAMDLFKKGQEEGLNFSNEMFDNISEYAPLFKQMNFSAEEYFTILANGTKNGAYNLDYINDLMKEFNIRVQDGSDKTSDAFSLMSEETQAIFEAFEKGEATTKDLFNSVIPELENMDDQVKANQIGVELFGTKFEDLEKTTVYSLDNMNDAFKDTEGAMDDFAKVQEESFGHQAKKTLRELLKAAEPIGKELMEMLENVTPKIEEFADWFVNLDDKTKDLIFTMGALTIATGPALKIFGTFGNSVSFLTKGFGGLDKAAGNKGVMGTFGRLVAKAGPIGVGIGLFAGLTAVVGSLMNKKKELNEISFETADALMEQHETTGKLIDQFDKLRDRSKLTQDEFGRYIDLQAELKEATDPQVIESIHKEMETLQKKSGLSNDELEDMVGWNNQIVETLPGATGAITDQGNKVATTTGKLEKYNDEISKMATLEMENEYFEAIENQSMLLEDKESIQRAINAAKGRENDIQELLNGNSEEELKEMKKKLQNEYSQLAAKVGNRDMAYAVTQEERNRKAELEKILGYIKDGKQGLTEQLLTEKQRINEMTTQLNTTEQQLAQFDLVTAKLQEHYLQQAGITLEQSRQAIKSGESLTLIQDQINKLVSEKEQLAENATLQDKKTGKYQEAVEEINNQIAMLENAEGQIQQMISVAGDYNKILSEPISKRVEVEYNYQTGKAEGTYRGVDFGPFQNQYADGTNFHPGGPALVGEEGIELAKKGNKWSLLDFGIKNLPRGTQVFTHDESKKILSALTRMPAYATGISRSGEADRIANGLSQGIVNNNQKIYISIDPSNMNELQRVIDWATGLNQALNSH